MAVIIFVSFNLSKKIIFVSFICSSVMAILHDNQEVVALCQAMFRDCSYEPESSYCIHCFYNANYYHSWFRGLLVTITLAMKWPFPLGSSMR